MAERTIVMNDMQYACYIISIIGALNWGLVALLNFDVVKTIFNSSFMGNQTSSAAQKIAYVLIGLGGAMCLFSLVSKGMGNKAAASAPSLSMPSVSPI
jgi:uncharacterized membrane protein YuzA (DUF378 family)